MQSKIARSLSNLKDVPTYLLRNVGDMALYVTPGLSLATFSSFAKMSLRNVEQRQC